jgi:ribosome-associated protein
LAKKRNSIQVKQISNTLLACILDALQELKAIDIIVLDLKEVKEASSDFFVICNGSSSTHINGLSDRVQKNVWETLGEKPYHMEGRNSKAWMLIDYFNIVIHIFDKEKRSYYALEQLWNDAVITKH